jgi:hypothetical protein
MVGSRKGLLGRSEIRRTEGVEPKDAIGIRSHFNPTKFRSQFDLSGFEVPPWSESMLSRAICTVYNDFTGKRYRVKGIDLRFLQKTLPV